MALIQVVLTWQRSSWCRVVSRWKLSLSLTPVLFPLGFTAQQEDLPHRQEGRRRLRLDGG